MLPNVRRVFGQSVVYGSADVAILAVNFLLVPVYTRVLSPTDYGVLALLLLLEAMLRPVTQAGLDHAFLRFYYDAADEADKRTLAGTIVICLLIANTGLLLALLAGAGPLSAWLLGSPAYTLAVGLLAVNLFTTATVFLPLGLLRVENRAAEFAGWSFARAAATIIGRLLLVVVFPFGVVGIMAADVIVSLGLVLALSPVLRGMMVWRVSLPMLGRMLQYGLPTVPYALLHQTMSMSDRFFLRLYVPLPDVGLYLLATTIAALLKFFPVAFARAWHPFAFDSMRRPDAPALFGRMATYAFTVLVGSAVVLGAVAEPLVVLMTPPAFHAATRVIPILALGITLQSLSVFIATSLYVSKRTRPFPATTLVAAAVTVAGHLLLIPRFGVIGAALAVAIGQAALSLVTLVFAQRVYRITYEGRRLALVTAVGGALFATTFLLEGRVDPVGWMLRAGVVAAFPLLLAGTRFLTRAEIDEARALWTRVQQAVRA